MIRPIDIIQKDSVHYLKFFLDLAAIAIDKILRGAERCVVRFADTVDKAEIAAEFVVHRFGAVADNVEAAAFLGAFETERGNDNMPSKL